MIRRVLSSLTTRVPCSLNLMSFAQRNRGFTPVSKCMINQQNANFSSILPAVVNATLYPSQFNVKSSHRFLEPYQVLSEQIRTVIKFSWKKGMRKSVRAVRLRFFRLHWGIWIRPIAGRHKKLWKKSAKRRNHLLKHVFCNATQSRMLDKMVNKFWRKPKYYIEDPYAPYHKRENFYITSTKPWRPEGVDYE